MNTLKKFIRLVNHGDKLKDKSILAVYVLNSLVWKTRRIKRNPKLIFDVTVRNKDCLFFCGKNIDAVWSASSLYEEQVEASLNITEGVFVDVGANIGKHTIQVAKKMKKGLVISIEPEPSNFEILKRNVALNNLSNVILMKTACGAKTSYRDLYLDEKGTSGHSLLKMDREKIRVKVSTLDEILRKNKIKADLIKIDVEGAEAEVLKGGKETLKQKPKLIFEAWNSEYLNKILEVIRPFKYKVKKISEENYLAE